MLGKSRYPQVNERAGLFIIVKILCTNKGLAYLLFSSDEIHESRMWNLKYGLFKNNSPHKQHCTEREWLKSIPDFNFEQS